jgi:hypothetical protein
MICAPLFPLPILYSMAWCLVRCDLFGTERYTNTIRPDAFSTAAYLCEDLKTLRVMEASFYPSITLNGGE